MNKKYDPFPYSFAKELIDKSNIRDLISIEHNCNVVFKVCKENTQLKIISICWLKLIEQERKWR